MQSFLQGLGVFFLLLIVLLLLAIALIGLIIVLIFSSLGSITAIDQQAKDYVRNAIQAITQRWNAQELFSLSSPRLSEAFNLEEWQYILQQCEQALGSMQTYQGAKGSLSGLPLAKNFKYIMRFFMKRSDIEAIENLLIGEYVAEAEFERGNAKFELQLLKQDENWLINFLEITVLNSSPTLEPVVFTLGTKTSKDMLLEDNKKKHQLEKLL